MKNVKKEKTMVEIQNTNLPAVKEKGNSIFSKILEWIKSKL